MCLYRSSETSVSRSSCFGQQQLNQRAVRTERTPTKTRAPKVKNVFSQSRPAREERTTFLPTRRGQTRRRRTRRGTTARSSEPGGRCLSLSCPTARCSPATTSRWRCLRGEFHPLASTPTKMSGQKSTLPILAGKGQGHCDLIIFLNNFIELRTIIVASRDQTAASNYRTVSPRCCVISDRTPAFRHPRVWSVFFFRCGALNEGTTHQQQSCAFLL